MGKPTLILAVVFLLIQPACMPSVDASRCQPATAAQIELINAGIQDVESSNYVATGWWVKSADFNNVYMVAALIYGPGIEDGAGPGVWAMGGTPDQPSNTFSVGGFAHQFSAWGQGELIDAQVTRSSDGVAEAEWCAQNKK